MNAKILIFLIGKESFVQKVKIMVLFVKVVYLKMIVILQCN